MSPPGHHVTDLTLEPLVTRTRPALLLAAAALALAGCGGSSGSSGASGSDGALPSASGAPAAQQFALRGTDEDRFVPERFTAAVGTLTLTLRNGQVPHNVVFDDPALPGIATVGGDQVGTTMVTFTKPGTYPFVCTIHPGMAGAVVVR